MDSEKLIDIILTIYQCGSIVNIHSYLKSFCILAVDVITNVTIKRQTSISLLSLLTLLSQFLRVFLHTF